MATKTKYLQLYKPAKNDYYNVETDQNENFDKLDKKIEEMDKTAKELKELADTKEDKFSKKSGFNLDKTSFLEDKEDILQTAKGVLNGDLAVVGSNSLNVFPLSSASKGDIYYHKGTNRYYICVNNYNGSSLTNPDSNFEELSVYTNRQRLDNLCIKEVELGTARNVKLQSGTEVIFDRIIDVRKHKLYIISVQSPHLSLSRLSCFYGTRIVFDVGENNDITLSGILKFTSTVSNKATIESLQSNRTSAFITLYALDIVI